MRDVKLCINDNWGFDEPFAQRLAHIKHAGFDGFFSGWRPGAPVAEMAAEAKKNNLIYQSIHAPFGEVDTVWQDGSAGEAYIKMLMDCVQACADNDVPLAIIHAIIGFDKHEPSEIGLERFDRLCSFADDRGILLGFENTEGLEYLDSILAALKAHPSCRFCWDTGHEMCYNYSQDLMAKYGALIAGTHLNDNLGITGQEITWLDDAHLLPFDGVADWEGIAKRLRKSGFDGPLTFELTRESKPGKDTHAAYAAWDCAEFARQAYARAVKFAQLMRD